MSKTIYALSLIILILTFAQSNHSLAQNGVRQIHQERSLYRNIIVTEDSQRRCLRFTITRRVGQNQSCRFLEDRQRLVFPYGKMLLTSLMVHDNPHRILIVGLGGGTLVEVYQHLFPEVEIVISEIDDAVLRVAEEYFDFEQNDKVSVIVGDARVHIKRAILREEKFDLIILDAFNGEYIPEHLMTMEFLQEVQSLLSENAMVISNTFSTSRLYDAESVTYQQVFGEFYNLRMSGTGNRIIITSTQALPNQASLIEMAPGFQDRLSVFDMDISDYPPYMSTDVDWNIQERLLTDQYSPANLLNN